MKSVTDLELAGQNVLVRVDFNVPLDEHGNITDDIRLKMVLPTLHYILERGAKLILCSHRGRPNGQRVAADSLAPLVPYLAEHLARDVTLAPDCVGEAVVSLVSQMSADQVILLENLRFHPGETANEPDFSEQLAGLATVYINDAFAVCHRSHASITGVAARVREKGAGFLLQKELDYFSKAMRNPVRPLAAIVGGAKVSSKITALQNMLDTVDKVIIGGAMANTFLSSQGVHMGGSMIENDYLDVAREFIDRATKKGVRVYLPVDFVVADVVSELAVTKNVTFRDIPDRWLALDIGPATTTYFSEALADVKTIVWNGPMGIFEKQPFARGTMALCHAVAAAHALSITGGGDLNAAVKKAGEQKNIGYMSTGGGAFLMLLEGKVLPGVAILE